MDFNPSGNCCGGYFQWSTGEVMLTTGSVWDGFSDGEYQGDDSGVAAFGGPGAGGRTFEWDRTHIGDDVDPLLVRLTLSWDYLAAGVYLVPWDDCCIFSDGVAVVSTDGAADQKILALDTEVDEVELFDNAGIPDCAGGAAFCYVVMDDIDFAVAVLDEYEVLLVGSHASTSVLTGLNLREDDIQTAAEDGLSIIVYSQPDEDTVTFTAHYDWLPNGFTHLAEEDDIAELTDRGQIHPSQLNQFDATLSDWDPSVETIFTDWPAYMDSPVAALEDALVVDGGGDAVTLAGKVSEGENVACILVSGQPVDLTATDDPGAPGPGIIPFEASQQLFRTNINYALNCPPV